MRLDRNLCHWRLWTFIAVLVFWPQAAPAGTITAERIAAALSKLEALAEARSRTVPCPVSLSRWCTTMR